MTLLIDNYDSFSYNLYQQVSALGAEVRVIKNDELSLSGIKRLNPERIIISPGPRTPVDSGVSLGVIQHFHSSIPILGVCLGHQCLAVACGSGIRPAQKLIFGKTTPITQQDSRLLAGIPVTFQAARYHALVIDSVPEGFRATSFDETGDIMSIEHLSFPLYGVQFHPESFLMLETGNRIIRNFLES